jgi:hypothetical protein
MAYEQLPDHFRTDFSTTWEARIARRESDFYKFCKKVPIIGEKKRYNQSDIVDMQEKTGRAQKTRISERTTYFRWLVPTEFDLAERLDEFDKDNLGDIALPDSDMMVQHVDAYNRKVDATIVAAVEGLAITGKEGTSSTPLSQIVTNDYGSATTASGLTLGKIIRANRYFKDNDLKRETKVFAFSPEAEDNLLTAVDEAKSSDYSNANIAATGTIDGQLWFGYNWVCHTGLTGGALGTGTGGAAGGNIDRNLAWCVNQIRFGDGQRNLHADILAESSHALQIRSVARMGAYRNEEKGVVAIETLAV